MILNYLSTNKFLNSNMLIDIGINNIMWLLITNCFKSEPELWRYL